MFYAFLKAVAARSAQMLNYSDIARDTGISQPTAKGYLSILEASGIVKVLPPYKTGETASLVVATPKVYMLDTGLMAYLTSWTSPETLAFSSRPGASPKSSKAMREQDRTHRSSISATRSVAPRRLTSSSARTKPSIRRSSRNQRRWTAMTPGTSTSW